MIFLLILFTINILEIFIHLLFRENLCMKMDMAFPYIAMRTPYTSPAA